MGTRRVEVPEYARVDLVDRLRKSLRYAQLRPGEMAAYLGVHRNTVGSYLRGSVRPDTRTLRLWAMRCGVPYEWLADGRLPSSRRRRRHHHRHRATRRRRRRHRASAVTAGMHRLLTGRPGCRIIST